MGVNPEPGLTGASFQLTACYTASFSMIMSLITANTAGSTKRSTVNGFFFVSYCVGNIIGPFAFKPSQAPEYTSGIVAVLVGYCAEIALLIGFAIYLASCNKLKARGVAALEQEHGVDEQERVLAGFSDLTDKENPYFEYRY